MEDRPITKEWLMVMLNTLPGKEKHREILERPEMRFIVPFGSLNYHSMPRLEVIARYDFSLEDWIIIMPQ